MTLLKFILGAFVGFIIAVCIAKYYEKSRWNDGVCRKCGCKWNLYKSGVGNDKIYKCYKGHTLSVTHKIDCKK